MLSKLFLITLIAFITALLAFNFREAGPAEFIISKKSEFKKNIVRCGPDWDELKVWLEETDIPPIPGSGTHRWKISTKNDSAQFYFNQGINMYYSFHIIEAMASFKKAARFDPGCAMLYWAQALAYGPNINDYGYTATYEAFLAAGRAIESCGACTEKEEMLIRAQRSRYTGDSLENREQLNKVYVDQMKEVYQKFPGDADVAALYADAMMLEHPWDLWYVNGTPKPWTPLIQEVLEKLLAKYPNHPGANHYYIHVMEPSPYFAKALPSANRLGKITPGLSHTVHMPSHIYLRSGNYQDGARVNENAVTSYKKSLELFAPVSGNEFIYVMHNLHMQTNHAIMLGQEAYSIQSADATRNSVPEDYLKLEAPLGSYMQYLYMTPVLVYVRFAKWDELLAMKTPGSTYPYASLLYHFGRGMAYAGKNLLSDASKELEKLEELMNDNSLQIPMKPFSPVIEGAKVAKNMLKGSIALAEKKYEEAIAAFKIASETEENMVYTEPRDWMLNPKHFLANAYLKAYDWEEAQNILLSDLKNNNENGWALYGLYQSLMGQNKNKEAEKVMARFKKAFSKSDKKLSGPVL